MLSLSAENADTEVDLKVINGEGDGGVPLGAELSEFAAALAMRNEDALTRARGELLRAGGPEVLVDAAAVAANFQRMVRIADSTGIPVDGLVDALSGSIQDDLNLRRFHSARNTPERTLFSQLKSVPLRFLAKRMLRKPR